jgi:hypothetical protein
MATRKKCVCIVCGVELEGKPPMVCDDCDLCEYCQQPFEDCGCKTCENCGEWGPGSEICMMCEVS